MPHIDQVFHEFAVFYPGVGLGDNVLGLVDGRQVFDLVGDLAIDNPAVGRLKEAIFVGPRVCCQTVDKADIRPFRRFDGTDAAIVGRVDIAHLETSPLARQASRPQRRDLPLVRHLGQRILLIHELRELTGAEELLDRGRDRFRVDHVLRHQPFRLGERKSLLHRSLDANQTDAERVFRHLPDRSHAPVAEVVDVVHGALAVSDIHQRAQHFDDIFVGQRPRTRDRVPTKAAVELHPPHGGQVVAFFEKEEVPEQIFGRFLRRRLAWTHHSIDLDQRLELRLRRVVAQRVRDIRPTVEIVRIDRVDGLDFPFFEFVHHVVINRSVARDDDFAGFRIDHIPREDATEQVLSWNIKTSQTRLLQHADMACRDAPAQFDDDVAGPILHVEAGNLASHPFGHKVDRVAILLEVKDVHLEEHGQDFLG